MKDSLQLYRQTLVIQTKKYPFRRMPANNYLYWDISTWDASGWRLYDTKTQVPVNRFTLRNYFINLEKRRRLESLWKKTTLSELPFPNMNYLESPAEPLSDKHQAFHLKFLFWQLPTAKRLHQIDPEKYPEDMCSLCGLCIESQDHWARCPFWDHLRTQISDRID